MEAILTFYGEHGLYLTLIAVIGICLLGALKYGNVFAKVKEDIRHVIYLTISIGLSLIGAAIYMTATSSFSSDAYILFATSVFALNQTFYNIFKVMTINDIIAKLLDLFIKKED